MVVRQGFARAGLSGSEVEDVVQETLLALHLKRQTWDAEQLFTPWVRAVARNKLIDNLRRRGNRTELPIEDFADVLPAEPSSEEISRTCCSLTIGAIPSIEASIVPVLVGMTWTRSAAAMPDS